MGAMDVYSSGTITTNASGAASHTTSIPIKGKILKIVWNYVDTTNTADPTIKTVSGEQAVQETIDSISNFGADAVHYPMYPAWDVSSAAEDGSVLSGLYVASKLIVEMSGGGDSKTFSVQIFYETM